MIYFKVKRSADQTPRRNARGKWTGGILVADELYTAREIEKYHINPKYVDKVNEKPKNTYWFFGCRFSDDPNLHNVETWLQELG